MGFREVKNPNWLREKEIFNAEMLNFPHVTKITTFNIAKYIIINPKPPS